MTLLELKTLVIDELKHVGDSVYDLGSTGNGTTFDARVRLMLNIFVEQTNYLFDPSYTISMSGQTNNSVVPSGDMYEVGDLYIDGLPLSRSPYYDVASAVNRVGVASGKPSEYSQIRRGTILFNCPLSAAAVSAVWKGSGFRKHATIANEAAQVELLENDALIFAAYCASKFIMPVILTEDALLRYQTTTAFARNGIEEIKAKVTEQMVRRH